MRTQVRLYPDVPEPKRSNERPDTLMQGHGALRNRLSRCLTLLVRQWHCNLTTDTTMPETAGVNLMASTERGEKALLRMRLIEDARCDPTFPLLAGLRRGNRRQAAERHLSIGLIAGVDQGSQIPWERGAKLQQAGRPRADCLDRETR
jgi:hypothetical protein